MSTLQDPEGQGHAGGPLPRRLFVYNRGLTTKAHRQILESAGWRVSLGLPKRGDFVGVWGMSPYAHRGEAMAQRCSVPLVRIEDAFMRSLFPGRNGEAPLGLLIDQSGIHFDASKPSDLETLLATHPLDDHSLLNRAHVAIARMRGAHLSKYSATRLDLPVPDPGYVLVVDQTAGDASVRASKADRNRFLEMLTFARQEHPGAPILIKTHPETTAGHRPGHFRTEDLAPGISFSDSPVSPWDLLEGARAVYTISSQIGFEAILAGHKPRVFGTPFYAGWGLTEDEHTFPRRKRRLSRAQLVAASLILFPSWYDPYRKRAGQIENVLDALEAQTRSWREDHTGWVASGMRMWKRAHLQKFFGQYKRLRFTNNVKKAQLLCQSEGRVMAWASTAKAGQMRVEDGFLRSRGLGAELTPPLSLVVDDLGIYYDPSKPSRLEQLIAASHKLRDDQNQRALRLIRHISVKKLSKYNLSGDLSTFPQGHRILVPGQVEDDASIRLGSSLVVTNTALLRKVREMNPEAVILYKPHPDVEAGLRPGRVKTPEAWADAVLENTSVTDLFPEISEVWTITSLTGFEAMLRNIPVTTFGAPFYAGWGLTRDLGEIPKRRQAPPHPSLAGLVHATLIDYPRYRDPVTGQPCSPEIILERLATGRAWPGGLPLRLLSKLQGLLATQAHLWR